METLGNEIMPKLCSKFYCENCDYGTSKKSSYDNHILSLKHQKSIKETEMESNVNEIMPKLCSSKFSCEKCPKEFKNRSGLWKHKQKCNESEEINDENNKLYCETVDKDQLILMLVKQNSELIKETSGFKNMMMEQQSMMLEVIKNGTQNHSNNIFYIWTQKTGV